MNINSMLIDLLKTATGLPVVQDEFDGKGDKYIIFTYTDEKPELWGNNLPIIDTAFIQIQLITPKSYNYFATKQLIRDTLEQNDFIVTSIRSFLGSEYYGTEKIRQTIFECQIALSR